MPEETQKIVNGLVKYLKVRNQLELLPEIVQRLEEVAVRLAPDNTALVTTAYQLSLPEKRLIKAQLETLFGRKLQLRLKVDTRIVSGMMIKVADKVIDLTLNTDLDELTKKLKD
jgi:F-type H+-transporting ATPase subunit delta